MLKTEENPDYLNSFLDYSTTMLNKSPNSIKEYNYDLTMFLKYIKIHFGLTKETNFEKITTKDISLDTIKKINLNDIHAFIGYLAREQNSKPATRARKVSTIRIFFKYLSQKAKLIDKNPAQDLETPKLNKRLPKYLNFFIGKKEKRCVPHRNVLIPIIFNLSYIDLCNNNYFFELWFTSLRTCRN